ncbi:hypothetical protein J2T55_001845 [Methylohalomonas lacus]|uniref:Uncharacterized protein n=1 Tax=Methylohalomonas lacus TaxID=398773 RepID=A0AAE3HM48_9GAMM|nr:hypothetical protein [Methylohalomonas lacus]MCS3903813.1 hypothetical protein [Methylohalomonas lacus]
MPLLIALVLAIPTLIGIAIAWYWLVCWGEVNLKPRYGDRKGFVLAAVVIPAVLITTISAAATLLGRVYGAYFLGAVLLGFAIFGLVSLYLRFIWRA